MQPHHRTEWTRNMKVLLIASSRPLREEFQIAAKELGTRLAENNDELIYGGGDLGLMGIVAGAARANGVKVKGIIPEVFYSINSGKEDDVLQRVDDLFERKKEMIQQSDIGVAVPGGIGSVDEIGEMAAANDIMAYANPDAHVKPIIILNLDDYYEGLKIQFARCVKEGAMSPNRMKMIHFVDSVDDALQVIEQYRQNPRPVRDLV